MDIRKSFQDGPSFTQVHGDADEDDVVMKSLSNEEEKGFDQFLPTTHTVSNAPSQPQVVIETAEDGQFSASAETISDYTGS